MSTKKDKPVCLRCSGEMERGFVADDNSVKTVVLYWTWQKPGRIDVRNVMMPATPAIDSLLPHNKNVTNREPLRMDAFRCSLCGYVEFYANDPLS